MSSESKEIEEKEIKEAKASTDSKEKASEKKTLEAKPKKKPVKKTTKTKSSDTSIKKKTETKPKTEKKSATEKKPTAVKKVVPSKKKKASTVTASSKTKVNALNAKIISGRRKTSISRIRLVKGTGKVVINNRDGIEYFKRKILINYIIKPFEVAEMQNQFDVVAKCHGGGLSGQAGALRLAISKTLNELYPKTRPGLKREGFLTRDARKVERKIYGHKKARKSFQFSKR